MALPLVGMVRSGHRKVSPNNDGRDGNKKQNQKTKEKRLHPPPQMMTALEKSPKNKVDVNQNK